MATVKPDMVNTTAAEALLWGEDATLLPKSFFKGLELARTGHVLTSSDFVNLSGDQTLGHAVGSRATARMGVRLSGVQFGYFLKEETNSIAVRNLLKRHPTATLALVRTKGPDNTRDVAFEVLGPSGELAATVTMRRSLAATGEDDALQVAYCLDTSTAFEDVAATDRYVAEAVVGKLISVQATLDIGELVGSLNDRGTPAAVSFAVRGTEYLPHRVSQSVDDLVAALRSDFHDWFGPFDDSESYCTAGSASTDGIWLEGKPDGAFVPA